jgi:predicted nicotinamide N-methyase
MTAIRVRYQTYECGEFDIHVRTLRDRQQYDDDKDLASESGISPASWPLFGVVWASGELLAQLMTVYEIKGKRILEVGCGIGLASLVLNHRSADITAMDYNPEAGVFMLQNTRLNQDADIPFVRTGWASDESELGKFDLIIGSDLLYERDNAGLLSGFIDRHASSHADIIITDPGRGIHPGFSKMMIALGFSHSQQAPDGTDQQGQPFRGQILRYTRLH